MPRTTDPLSELERLQARFGDGQAGRKLELLQRLQRARLPTAAAVLRLHEVLCFLRAHPDDAAVLQQVTAMLQQFERRADLRRFRRRLSDSGVAGTAITYVFFASTARWLAQRFPGRLRVVWRGYDKADLLDQRLPLLASFGETPALDEVVWPMRDWVRRLAGPDTTDAEFLIARCARVGGSEFERDAFYEELGLELELRPGPGLPSRTKALLPGLPVSFQQAPLRRQRPDLAAVLRLPPAPVRTLDRAAGARAVQLAREAMVLRHRDLDAFAHGDADDVRLFDCGGGLQFAVIGVQPGRRLLLEAVYAYLTLQNGVPIGYVLTSGLFGSSEIAFNVFDTWRGGEAAHVYGQVLRVTRQLYGSDTFTVYPYQLGGDGNDEGLRSGAWWFYQKLGFRAREPEVLALMQQELRAMQRRPEHRTGLPTLRRLAAHNVYWSAGRARDDVIGVFPLACIGLAVTDLLARRFGADRERGERTCAAEALRLCGGAGMRGWPAGERLAFRRWAPLILALPGVADWPLADRRALLALVRQKGGRRESDYAQAVDAHRRLRAALRRLAATVDAG